MSKESVIKKEIGKDRWGNGTDHHAKSVELVTFLRDIDFAAYGDYFGWKTGGDGDNGETLAYQMDAFFEAKECGEL